MHAFAINAVKNPYPQFKPDGKTHRLLARCAAEAEKFSTNGGLRHAVMLARSRGQICRFPREERRRAIDAAFPGIFHHYDILRDCLGVPLRTLAIKTGLMTESDAGNTSMTRLTRLAKYFERLGIISYTSQFCADIGCYFPAEIKLTRLAFELLGIPYESFEKARAYKVKQENLSRMRKGLEALPFVEVVSSAIRAAKDRFYQKRLIRKQRGEARALARRDAARKRSEIKERVTNLVYEAMRKGKFKPQSLTELRNRIEELTNKRTIHSRNYTLLNT